MQIVIALSTTEAECMTVTETVKEANWLRGIVAEVGFEQKLVSILSKYSECHPTHQTSTV